MSIATQADDDATQDRLMHTILLCTSETNITLIVPWLHRPCHTLKMRVLSLRQDQVQIAKLVPQVSLAQRLAVGYA